jgi:hypothetical protein
MTITTSPPVARPTRVRRAAWLVLLWLLVLPGAAWAVLRLGGWERGPLVQLFAFTPYVAAWSVVPAVAALATRRWLAAAVATVALALLATAVLPRAFADGDRGPQTGVKLHVMTSNMLFGGADPAQIVQLVRDNDVAVLAVQEFTPAARKRLADASTPASRTPTRASAATAAASTRRTGRSSRPARAASRSNRPTRSRPSRSRSWTAGAPTSRPSPAPTPRTSPASCSATSTRPSTTSRCATSSPAATATRPTPPARA